MSLKEMGYRINVFYYENPLHQYKNINLLKNLGIECMSFNVVNERR